MRDLPVKPSLEHLKGQAKDLMRAHQRGQARACATLRWLPHLHTATDEEILSSRITLQEVQGALAMDYGFHSWSALRQYVEDARAEQDEAVVVPDRVLEQWQRAVDALARSIGVASALVMRLRREDIEVFLRSRNEGNPYQVGEKEQLIGSGLFCERVVSTRTLLHVPFAPTDAEWRDNPDAERGLVSYLGLPLILPTGVVFGTICVLDREELVYSSTHHDLLLCMRQMIESHLETLYMRRSMEHHRRQLTDSLEALRNLHGLVPVCAHCRRVQIPDGTWRQLEEMLRSDTGIEFTHGICPDCEKEAFRDV